MFSKNVKISRVMNSQAAGTDDTIESSVVDMQNFESVTFIAAFGEITTSAVTKIVAQQGDLSNGSDMSDLEGSSVSIDDDEDNQLLVLEIKKPQKRYVQVNVIRATANAVIDGVIAIQDGASKKPITQPATVADTEAHASPDEGTA